jgi:hypothetical protein
MASGSTKQKWNVFTLEESVQAIKLFDAGKPAYKVAEDSGFDINGCPIARGK